jgi:hypothetical protein
MIGRIILVSTGLAGVAGLVLAPMNLAGAVGTVGFGALAAAALLRRHRVPRDPPRRRRRPPALGRPYLCDDLRRAQESPLDGLTPVLQRLCNEVEHRGRCVDG